MIDSTTRTTICPRPAAPDRHGPNESVARLCPPSARGAWHPRMHGHLAARAAESII